MLYPIPSLGGMTPLEAADIPTIDMLASKGEIGTVRTVPEGISPGSDSANLSVMGYDPRKYLTGRSPLEAAAIGVDMLGTDISFRANFITIDPAGEAEYEDYIVRDHAAGDITTEECAELLKSINDAFADENLYFHTGTGYRHCMLLKKDHPHAHTEYKCVPPHDILITAESKGIPLVHEMARQEGAETYVVARKGPKLYMKNPFFVEVQSISTAKAQRLYLDETEAAKLKGRRVLIVDDVISTGESLRAVEHRRQSLHSRRGRCRRQGGHCLFGAVAPDIPAQMTQKASADSAA